MKVSKIAGRRCKEGLRRGLRTLVRDLGGGSCGPGPTELMRVPGSGKGVQPLDVCYCRSGLMRRTLHEVLRTMFRPVFCSRVVKFEPGENYRGTVHGLGVVLREGPAGCILSTSVGKFFRRLSRR